MRQAGAEREQEKRRFLECRTLVQDRQDTNGKSRGNEVRTIKGEVPNVDSGTRGIRRWRADDE
jgi:hypothetical protein